MKTLNQIQEAILKKNGFYPEAGDTLLILQVKRMWNEMSKEWLQQKQEKIGNQLTDTTENAVLQRLLEELKEKKLSRLNNTNYINSNTYQKKEKKADE